jgi:hypothetical protein
VLRWSGVGRGVDGWAERNVGGSSPGSWEGRWGIEGVEWYARSSLWIYDGWMDGWVESCIL